MPPPGSFVLDLVGASKEASFPLLGPFEPVVVVVIVVVGVALRLDGVVVGLVIIG